jgi:hypothetical protein
VRAGLMLPYLRIRSGRTVHGMRIKKIGLSTTPQITLIARIDPVN